MNSKTQLLLVVAVAAAGRGLGLLGILASGLLILGAQGLGA